MIDLDEKIIKYLSEQYNFKLRIFGDTVVVDTATDEFKIEHIPLQKHLAPIDLWHKSNCKGYKMHYHYQGYFFSWRDVFKYMYDHQNKYKFKKYKKYQFAI